tara:strand:- start:100 stop:222 length:123 start_codon:yes stop_codon:yes gene_type:complete
MGIGLPNTASVQDLFSACSTHGEGTALELRVNHEVREGGC